MAENCEALLFVPAVVGNQVTVKEFNDWYDGEHAPARLKVPGIRSANRYIDVPMPAHPVNEPAPPVNKPAEETPYLACYDIDTPQVLDSPEYKELLASASDNELRIRGKLALLDRRVYDRIAARGTLTKTPPPEYLLSAVIQPETISEDELNRWYEEEHTRLISEMPGWVRSRRYKLRGATQPNVGQYLAVHEFTEADEILDGTIYKRTGTDWTKKVMAGCDQKRREIHLYKLYRSF